MGEETYVQKVSNLRESTLSLIGEIMDNPETYQLALEIFDNLMDNAVYEDGGWA